MFEYQENTSVEIVPANDAKMNINTCLGVSRSVLKERVKSCILLLIASFRPFLATQRVIAF